MSAVRKVKRVSGTPRGASSVWYTGRICTAGYQWEVREPGRLPANHKFSGTILDQDFGGDFIVPNGGELRPLSLELDGFKAFEVTATRERKRCHPILDLANSLLDEHHEKGDAIAVVERYGLPNDYTEIGLDEFQRLACKFDHFLTQCAAGHLAWLKISPPPRIEKIVEADGSSRRMIKTFQEFCMLQAQALFESQREIRRCEFCRKWYALDRRRDAGRGAASPERVRFCPYGACRQKAYSLRI